MTARLTPERLAELARLCDLVEICDECGEVVRYWTDSGNGGGASCACCTEGPEACDPVAEICEAPRLLLVAAKQILPDLLADLADARREVESLTANLLAHQSEEIRRGHLAEIAELRACLLTMANVQRRGWPMELADWERVTKALGEEAGNGE